MCRHRSQACSPAQGDGLRYPGIKDRTKSQRKAAAAACETQLYLGRRVRITRNVASVTSSRSETVFAYPDRPAVAAATGNGLRLDDDLDALQMRGHTARCRSPAGLAASKSAGLDFVEGNDLLVGIELLGAALSCLRIRPVRCPLAQLPRPRLLPFSHSNQGQDNQEQARYRSIPCQDAI